MQESSASKLPRHELVRIVAHVLETNYSEAAKHLILSDLTAETLAEIEELAKRRLSEEPLQHIIGTAPFRNLELKVSPEVFIPRPETEVLVSEVIAFIRKRQEGRTAPPADCVSPARTAQSADSPERTERFKHLERLQLLDLCSGSGAIAIALATELKSVDVTAVELSPEAARILQENIAKYAATVEENDSTLTLIEGDAATVSFPQNSALSSGGETGEPPAQNQFDIIASNPPYVPERERENLPEDVLHDPELALFSGADGFELPRQIISRAPSLLKASGFLIIEHFETQAKLAREAFEAAGFANIRTVFDLAGKVRFTCGVLAAAL